MSVELRLRSHSMGFAFTRVNWVRKRFAFIFCEVARQIRSDEYIKGPEKMWFRFCFALWSWQIELEQWMAEELGLFGWVKGDFRGKYWFGFLDLGLKESNVFWDINKLLFYWGLKKNCALLSAELKFYWNLNSKIFDWKFSSEKSTKIFLVNAISI